MLSSHCYKETVSKDSSQAGCSTQQSTLVLTRQTNLDNNVKCHTITTSLSDSPSTKSDNQAIKKNCPNLFWIKGAIRRENVCPSWFHLTKVYSCVAMVTDQENDAGLSGLSGWFQRLMISLARQNLLLVCNTVILGDFVWISCSYNL
jgi:hypothetical protein